MHYTETIICPYPDCQYDFGYSLEYGRAGDIQCPECERMFSFVTDETVYFASERNCFLNGEIHVWRDGKCVNCDQRQSKKAKNQRVFEAWLKRGQAQRKRSLK